MSRGRFDFDLAVIGAGAAGLSVASVTARLGASVALIERDRMGGDCLNTGCVPSKALLAASRAACAVRQAARFGITSGDPVIDWDRLRGYVNSAVAELAPADSAERFRAMGAVVLFGEARFLDPNTLSVAGRTLTARRFVIAAGSRPAVPEIEGLKQIPYWTNETLFALHQRPDHLLILGGGPIGLEMADAFTGLGVQVTIFERAQIAAREDPELVAGLRKALMARGVTVREDIEAVTVAGGPLLTLSDGSQISGSHLLVATGRRPDLAGLDLAAAGIQAGPAGVATDRGLRSLTNRRVFAVGDIADPAGIGPRAFTHVGSYHAGIVIRRALFRLPARLDYTALPRVTYTDPELAQTGLTEAEARAAGHSVQVLRWQLARNDRAVTEGDTTGMVKLVVSRGRVLGAGILASNAGEMISLWSHAIERRTPLSVLAALIVPYPTRSEAGKRAASSFFEPRLFSARTKSLVRILSRWP
jgi:pyruvate/2-oxoglutarate dehydrogenase complex dihydrolipoamide dehydrogenase (E3) component